MNTSLRTHPFVQVDVFSQEAFGGNPVAVVLNAEGIDDATMLRIARWTNLSETTFILPPSHEDADYFLRIFTPTGEIPFAGHPTLGSARAWLHHHSSDQQEIVQECGAGLVTIRRDGERLSFAAPPVLRSGPIETDYLHRIVEAFGISPEQVVDHQWVDNGPGWAVVQLATAQEVLELEPNFSLIPDAMVGAIGAYPAGSPHAFEIRAFAPGVSVPEDPVTGSLNASVAQWMTSSGDAEQHYTVAQGTRLHRTGEITIDVEGTTVWVGGSTTVCFFGNARI